MGQRQPVTALDDRVNGAIRESWRIDAERGRAQHKNNINHHPSNPPAVVITAELLREVRQLGADSRTLLVELREEIQLMQQVLAHIQSEMTGQQGDEATA